MRASPNSVSTAPAPAKPMRAPASTSLTKWASMTKRDTKTRLATITAGRRQRGAAAPTATISAATVVAWPEGKLALEAASEKGSKWNAPSVSK